MIISEKEHWEKIYSRLEENKMSWFQSYPKTSIEFLELFNLPLTANIIDIGGGSSHFADVLLEKGYSNIWVLDISETAIESAKTRLGRKSERINWVVADIIDFRPTVKFDFWHDRAAFHFLTSETKINKYISIAEDGVRKDGYLVLGTFSEEGPEKCSGLEIKQSTEASMSDRFETSFDRIKCIHEDHITPFKSKQNFLFCSFKRK